MSSKEVVVHIAVVLKGKCQVCPEPYWAGDQIVHLQCYLDHTSGHV